MHALIFCDYESRHSKPLALGMTNGNDMGCGKDENVLPTFPKNKTLHLFHDMNNVEVTVQLITYKWPLLKSP